MDTAQAARMNALKEKCAAEIEELKAKQKKEYDVLVSTAHCTLPDWPCPPSGNTAVAFVPQCTTFSVCVQDSVLHPSDANSS